MSENQDEKLVTMLRYRRIEPARPNLAQRIILKAQSIRQTQKIPLLDRGSPKPLQKQTESQDETSMKGIGTKENNYNVG
jgi:hypothetical protein